MNSAYRIDDPGSTTSQPSGASNLSAPCVVLTATMTTAKSHFDTIYSKKKLEAVQTTPSDTQHFHTQNDYCGRIFVSKSIACLFCAESFGERSMNVSKSSAAGS